MIQTCLYDSASQNILARQHGAINNLHENNLNSQYLDIIFTYFCKHIFSYNINNIWQGIYKFFSVLRWTLVLVYFIVINHNVILPDDTNYLHNMFIFCSTQPGLELSSLWIIPLCSHRSIFPLSDCHSITYLHKFMQTMEH